MRTVNHFVSFDFAKAKGVLCVREHEHVYTLNARSNFHHFEVISKGINGEHSERHPNSCLKGGWQIISAG